QEIDLHGQINDTLTILQTRLRKGSNIQIIKRYDQNLPLVQCYAGQLSQVFMNILSNAIDALRGDSQGINSNRLSKTFCQDNVWRGESNCGESNCSESNCSKSDHSGSSHGDNYRRKICICTRLYDDSAVITVADNGPGMDEITREKLFEPFFTTKSVEKGTGLGMAIAHRVVTERHGGTISCHSAPGQGTVFTVTLPLKPTPLQPTAQRAIVNSAQVAWGRVL
ncbi:MAG: HAMP domain-containing sensor histidine kinase, partial [Cyanobacteria bacterium P01_F01_bin.153]